MVEESKPPSKSFKVHVVNLIASIVAAVGLAGFFLIALHIGTVFSEAERIGIIGGILAAFGGAVYSAKKLPS